MHLQHPYTHTQSHTWIHTYTAKTNLNSDKDREILSRLVPEWVSGHFSCKPASRPPIHPTAWSNQAVLNCNWSHRPPLGVSWPYAEMTVKADWTGWLWNRHRSDLVWRCSGAGPEAFLKDPILFGHPRQMTFSFIYFLCKKDKIQPLESKNKE